MSDLAPIELIADAADKLGDLVSEVVFLGGAVVGLLVTDTATRPPRATKDVDVAIEISSLVDFYELDKRLRAKGFENDIRGPVCRYLHGSLMIDVMPTHLASLGSANRWYKLALETAQPHVLDSGTAINLITATCFLATKMEAYNSPNREDHHDILVSRDFGDVIRVIDGRPSIVGEVKSALADLRNFLRERFAGILHENYLEEAISEHVDAGRQDLVVERIKSLVAAQC